MRQGEVMMEYLIRPGDGAKWKSDCMNETYVLPGCRLEFTEKQQNSVVLAPVIYDNTNPCPFF
jgi:hypothetical protein